MSHLEESFEVKDYQVTSLQRDLSGCQDNLRTLTSEKEKMEAKMDEMKVQEYPKIKTNSLSLLFLRVLTNFSRCFSVSIATRCRPRP